MRINIKPLSINEAWKGKLKPTGAQTKYKRDVGMLLRPDKNIPTEGNLTVEIVFGFSSKAADIDNPLKLFLDCLQDYYGFDDKQIYELIVKKEVVKRGQEYIDYFIKSVDK